MISLNNIRMRNKLMLMLVLPVLSMLYFSVGSLTSSFQSADEMEQLQENMVLAGKISVMVHEVQKERGMSAGYLGSKGEKFASEIITQRHLTDKKIADLRKFIELLDGSVFERQLDSASKVISLMINLRSKVTDLNVSVGDAVTVYTSVNTAYLDVIGRIANASPDGSTARMASAYYNFLQGKERAGIERAVLAGTFAKHEFDPGMYRKFSNLVAAQTLFEGRFSVLATDEMKALHRNTMNSPVIAETERMRNIAFSSATLGDSVLSIDANNWFDRQTDKINLMKNVDDGLADILNTYANDVKTAAQKTLFLSALITALSLLAAIVATYFIQKNIITRLKRAETVAEAVAGGDISEVIALEGDDEISHLLQSMKIMTARLSEVVGKVQSNAGDISNSAGEISDGAGHLSQRTEEQASSLEETSSSMEEMASTVKQNADNAFKAKQLVSEAKDQAESGCVVVSELIGAMAKIDDSSKKIAEIIGTVNDIAFQTNLLALNAAVEAARAGDEGRGFAVVATEVRNLAQRSASAAKDIKVLINDSVDRVSKGSDLVDRSGETLSEIAVGVGKAADIVAEISAASAEQSAGIDQMGKAIIQMDEVTQQNAALVEESAAASKLMECRAVDLEQVVSYFRLSDTGVSDNRTTKNQEYYTGTAKIHELAQAREKAQEKKVEEKVKEMVKEKARHKLSLPNPDDSGSDKTGTQDENWKDF